MYYGWVGSYIRAAERESARSAKEAEGVARRAESVAIRIQDQLERQALLIRSLLEMCARKGLFTSEEFRALVNEVDLSDGRLDGKFKAQGGPRNCPECGKVNGKHAVACMYCSTPLPDRELM